MKNKERELLVQKLDELRKYLDTNAFLKLKYPELETRVDEVYQGILYDKVDDKSREDGKGDNRRLEQLEAYCQAIQNFIEDIQTVTAGSASSQKFLSYELLSGKKNDLKLAIAKSDEAFQDGVNAMHAFIDGISTGLTMAEVAEGLVKAVRDAYVSVKFEAIKKTTNFRAVKQLGIPVIDNFVDNRKKYHNPPQAPFSGAALRNSLESIFSSAYVMNEADFAKDLSIWIDAMKGQVNNLVTHKYTKCEVAVDIIAQNFTTQIKGLGSQQLFAELATQAETAINASKEGAITQMGAFAAALVGNLDAINKMIVTIDQLVDVYEPNFFSVKLNTITLDQTIIQAVNTNSPYYVVGQPNFEAEFTSKLSTWKEEMSAALDAASGIVLELDGATFNADKFKQELLSKVNKELTAIFQPLAALPIQTIKLERHTDLSEFTWGSAWKSTISSIDVSVLLQSEDVELKANLYRKTYDYLPLKEEVKGALLLSITDKVNLALEQAEKNAITIEENRQQINIVNQNVNTFKAEVKQEFNEVNQNIETFKTEVKQEFNEVNQNIEQVQETVINIDNKVTNLNTKIINLEQNSIEINNTVNNIKEGNSSLLNINYTDNSNTEINFTNNGDININTNENTNTTTIKEDEDDKKKGEDVVVRFSQEFSKVIKLYEYKQKIPFASAWIASCGLELGVEITAKLGLTPYIQGTNMGVDAEASAKVTGSAKLYGYVGVDVWVADLAHAEIKGGVEVDAIAGIYGKLALVNLSTIQGSIDARFAIKGRLVLNIEAGILDGLGEWKKDWKTDDVTLFECATKPFVLAFDVAEAFGFKGAGKSGLNANKTSEFENQMQKYAAYAKSALLYLVPGVGNTLITYDYVVKPAAKAVTLGAEKAYDGAKYLYEKGANLFSWAKSGMASIVGR